MSVVTLQLDGRAVATPAGSSLLAVCRAAGISLPTLCHLDGLSPVGACRLCLVELEGAPRPVAACVSEAAEGMVVRSDTPELRRFRRMAVELFFAEGNHVCAVCVADGHCELQQVAVLVGMDHVRFPARSPLRAVDASHPRFLHDPNRCILCSRCVRACDELEGAHVWDIAERGSESRLVAGLDQPWGEVSACTNCGHCVDACPTAALVPQQLSTGERRALPGRAAQLAEARQQQRWHNQGEPPP